MGAELRIRTSQDFSISQETCKLNGTGNVTNLSELNHHLLWKLIPIKLYRWWCYWIYLFWFVMGILVLRKTRNAVAAVSYVKMHGHTVSDEAIMKSSAFSNLLWSLEHKFEKPPAIFFLNQYALNMTFNFLCNTRYMQNAHERFIFVTLDDVARDVLREYWPNVEQIYWPTPSLYVSTSFLLISRFIWGRCDIC